MRKASVVAQVIQKRIVNGDHRLQGLPSERRLAEELGMSRTTVRAAVQMLVEEGVLVRGDNGRLGVSRREAASRTATIGIVMPACNSPDQDLWREAVEVALEGRSARLRVVTYTHWADPVIADAVTAFDGLFFVPAADQPPAWLLARLRDADCRVVVLDQDYTAADLPSVVMFPPNTEHKLFDHLVDLGHQRIDCINAQTDNDIIRGRIAVWRDYIESHCLTGQFRSLTLRRAVEGGYRIVQETLAGGRALGTALFCTTGAAAIGVMRALHEAKFDVGRDISVCAVNDEGLGHYLLKTLTALETPPRAPYLRRPVEWMLASRAWQGPLLIQPVDVPLFQGESTGPPRETRHAKPRR